MGTVTLLPTDTAFLSFEKIQCILPCTSSTERPSVSHATAMVRFRAIRTWVSHLNSLAVMTFGLKCRRAMREDKLNSSLKAGHHQFNWPPKLTSSGTLPPYMGKGLQLLTTSKAIWRVARVHISQVGT